MRRELRYALIAALALATGATAAEPYARLAIPYYNWVAAHIAGMHPWRVLNLSLARDGSSPGASLRITGEVRRHVDDPAPAARVVVRVDVGEVVETPLVFWTLLLAWPMATWRRRLIGLGLAIPVFLALEAATTGCQLVHTMAQASAVLAGEPDPLTVWERWSRFLEAGGRFALELGAALLVIAVSAVVTRSLSLPPAAQNGSGFKSGSTQVLRAVTESNSGLDQ